MRGHATLASAFVVSHLLDQCEVSMRFKTKSGILTVKQIEDIYKMDFPARKPTHIELAAKISQSIGRPVVEFHLPRDLCLAPKAEASQIHAMFDCNIA